MSQKLNAENITVSSKTPVCLPTNKRSTYATILISAVVIVTFVTYYIIAGEESRKKNSLQLVVAVSKLSTQSLRTNFAVSECFRYSGKVTEVRRNWKHIRTTCIRQWVTELGRMDSGS